MIANCPLNHDAECGCVAERLECLGLPARPPPVVPARRVAAALFESATDWSRD